MNVSANNKYFFHQTVEAAEIAINYAGKFLSPLVLECFNFYNTYTATEDMRLYHTSVLKKESLNRQIDDSSFTSIQKKVLKQALSTNSYHQVLLDMFPEILGAKVSKDDYRIFELNNPYIELQVETAENLLCQLKQAMKQTSFGYKLEYRAYTKDSFLILGEERCLRQRIAMSPETQSVINDIFSDPENIQCIKTYFEVRELSSKAVYSHEQCVNYITPFEPLGFSLRASHNGYDLVVHLSDIDGLEVSEGSRLLLAFV